MFINLIELIVSFLEVIQNPIYSEWLDDWDSMILGVSELCDNCIYIMRNIEGEDTRQVKFFETADEKKINLLKAVLGLDFYVYENEVSYKRRLVMTFFYFFFLFLFNIFKSMMII